MLMRSVIGSLAAVGALGAVGAALPERHAGTSPAPVTQPSFGSLPRVTASTPPASQDAANAIDAQSLIRLAAYATPQAGAPAAAPAATRVPAPRDLPQADATPLALPVGQPDTQAPQTDEQVAALPGPATEASVASDAPALPDAPAKPEPSRPQAVAALPAPQKPDPATPAATAGRVNINRASVAELDHLGGGRIGVAIARRRPYASVDDLVRKRVVRASLFARIRSAITVD